MVTREKRELESGIVPASKLSHMFTAKTLLPLTHRSKTTDSATVDKYTDAIISQGLSMPWGIILIWYTGTIYRVIDGNHRLEVAIALGLDVNIKVITDEKEAMYLCATVNLANVGKEFTAKEKQAAFLGAFAADPKRYPKGHTTDQLKGFKEKRRKAILAGQKAEDIPVTWATVYGVVRSTINNWIESAKEGTTKKENREKLKAARGEKKKAEKALVAVRGADGVPPEAVKAMTDTVESISGEVTRLETLVNPNGAGRKDDSADPPDGSEIKDPVAIPAHTLAEDYCKAFLDGVDMVKDPVAANNAIVHLADFAASVIEICKRHREVLKPRKAV